jgi:hypothetical protein
MSVHTFVLLVNMAGFEFDCEICVILKMNKFQKGQHIYIFMYVHRRKQEKSG